MKGWIRDRIARQAIDIVERNSEANYKRLQERHYQLMREVEALKQFLDVRTVELPATVEMRKR